MSGKPDIRGYINPFVPGGKKESGQRANMPPSAEIYVERRDGKIIATFIRSLRAGSIAAVEELHYLAPGQGRADKRRRIMGERVTEITRGRKAVIRENFRGLTSEDDLPTMLLHASDQIARSGQARRRDKEGRPPEWPKPPATMEDYEAIWRRRGLDNDAARRNAIIAKFGRAPSIGTLRRLLGSPHQPRKS
jgi:hypothetical protein